MCVLLSPSTHIPVARADWDLVSTGEHERDISGLGWLHQWWTGLDTDNKLRFDWTASPYGLDFYIFDDENYDLWSSGYSCTAQVIREGLISDDFDWRIPRNGETWHIVWYNDALFSTHLSCDYYKYEWVTPPPTYPFPYWPTWGFTPILLIIVCIVVAVVVIAIVVYVVVHHYQKPEPDESATPPTRACPKCKTVLASDDVYCGECGSKVA
jgi:hypothetical protein